MISNEQIQEFKDRLLQQKKELEERISHDQETVVERSQRDSSGELSSYDNHPADMGTELFEKERNMALDDHAESEVEKIGKALEAIEDGSYGTCKTCGCEIPYERLDVVPTSLYCVDHTPEKSPVGDRPSEEDILIPTKGNDFEDRRKGNEINDKEDSFAEVARFGTSETPADFTKDTEDYDKLYETEDETDGFPEEYEGYLGNDINGDNRKAYPTKHLEDTEETLEDKDIDSQLGDVPYKKKDSYIDE